MPQITITINVSEAKLASLFSGKGDESVITLNSHDPKRTVLIEKSESKTPSLKEALPDFTAKFKASKKAHKGPGRPASINDEGYQYIWAKHLEGYSANAIGKSVGLTGSGVLHFINRVKAHTTKVP